MGGSNSNNNSISRSTSKKPYGTLPRNGGILIAVRDWSKKTPPLTAAADPTNYYEKLLLNSTKLKQRDHQHFYENHSIIRKCKDSSSSSSLLSIEPVYAVVNKLNKKRSKNNASTDEPKLRSTTSEYATITLNNNNNNDNEKHQQQISQGEIEGATIENQQNENNEFSIYAKVWKGPKKSSESKMYVRSSYISLEMPFLFHFNRFSLK